MQRLPVYLRLEPCVFRIHLAELHYELSFDNELSRCTLRDSEPQLGDPGIQCLVGFHPLLTLRAVEPYVFQAASVDVLLGCAARASRTVCGR
jgi:hypothetical protein